MVTYQQFWDALYKEDYDSSKFPFTPFHRHIRETYTLYKRINQQDIRIKELEERLKLYEQNGAAKMYYSLNKKMNEIADLLNAN